MVGSAGGGPDRAPKWRRRGAVAVVAGLGVLTFLAHGYHLATNELSAMAVLFGVAMPMAVSLTLVGSAVWLSRAEIGPNGPRVAAWSLTGAVMLVALTDGIIVFQRSVGGFVSDVSVVLLMQASVGALIGFLLGVYDVERQLSSERLAEEHEMAILFSRRLNVLNRVLRHDIRNKVNVIRGNADLVAAGTDETETAAQTIRHQADQMFQLSEYARELQAVLDQEAVNTEPIDVGTTIAAKAMRLRRDHGYATIHQDVDDGAWADVSPFVDSAIENLLANAIEHNDAASPTVWVDVAVGDDVVRVRISDDGPGIPPEEVAVLQRGRETSLEHASGLGLWLVHWIVTESGGTVSFEEREPTGSVVELTLPRTEPPDSTDSIEVPGETDGEDPVDATSG